MSSQAEGLRAQRHQAAQAAYAAHREPTENIYLCREESGPEALACRRVRELLTECFGIDRRDQLTEIGLELMAANPDREKQINTLVTRLEQVWDVAEEKAGAFPMEQITVGPRYAPETKHVRPSVAIRDLCNLLSGVQLGERTAALQTLRGRLAEVMQAADVQEPYRQRARREAAEEWDQNFGPALRALEAEGVRAVNAPGRRGVPVSLGGSRKGPKPHFRGNGAGR